MVLLTPDLGAPPGITGVEHRGPAWRLKQDHGCSWAVVGLYECDPHAIHNVWCVQLPHDQPVQRQLEPQVDQTRCDGCTMYQTCQQEYISQVSNAAMARRAEAFQAVCYEKHKTCAVQCTIPARPSPRCHSSTCPRLYTRSASDCKTMTTGKNDCSPKQQRLVSSFEGERLCQAAIEYLHWID